MAELVEELNLDISPALDALAPLGAALTDLATSFSAAIGDAIGTVSAPIATDQIIDAPAITTSIDTAIGDVSAPPIPIDGDTTSLDSGIADALDQPRPPVDVEGDTSALTDAIDTATADATATVPVDADTTAAQASIDALATPTAPIDITVTADTTEAQSAINDLDTSATDATTSVANLGDSATGTTGSLGNLSDVTNLLSGAASAASGDATSLADGLGGIGLKSAAAGAGLLALGGFIDHVVNLAAEGQAQNNLFNATFGAMATAVQSIHVDGLNLSLSQLASESGTVNSKLEESASRIGAMGNSAGAAAPQIVTTTDNVLALAGTLSVTNPSLGDAADVTDRLTRLLETGGARLGQYGISLSSAQINAKALSLGLAQTSSALTPFDKLVAGSDLAVQEFGSTLGLKFAAGSQNAQVQLRALGTAFDETLAAIGQPLLQPTINLFADLIPILQQVGVTLGDIGQVAIPIFSAFAPILSAAIAPLKLIGDGFVAIGDALNAVPTPILTVIAAGILAIGTAADITGLSLTFLLDTNPLLLALAGSVAIIGAAFDSFSQHSKDVATDTKNWTDALFGAGSGATTLDGQLAALDGNIQKVSSSFIEGQKDGSAFRTALDSAGGATGLSNALLGTKADFDTYTKSVVAASTATSGLTSGFVGAAITQGLNDQRAALQASEQAQLQGLVSTNLLTQAQLDQIESSNKLADGTTNYSAALQAASVIADKVTADQNAAQDAAAVSAKNFGASATQVFSALAAGSITTDQAKADFENLGLTVTTAGNDVSAFGSAWSSFLSSASKVPDASTAITAFVQGAATATSTVASAVASQTKTVQSEADKVTVAYDAIALAHEKGGKAGVTAVQNAEITYQKALDTQKTADKTATDQVLGATEAMFAAAAPQTLIDQLKSNLTEIADFEDNLKKIVANGGIELAQQFAAQGPQVAAAQAATFATDPGGTKQAEALITQGDSAKQKYLTYITGTFAPQIAAEVEKSLNITPPAPDLTTPTKAALTKVVGTVNADGSVQTSIVDLSARVAHAFDPDFDQPITTAFGKVVGTVNADGSIQTSILTLSGKTAAAYKPDVAGAATTQLSAAATTIANFDKLAINMGTIGHSAGVAFDSGIAEGINDGQDSTFLGAVDALASRVEAELKKAWGIKSPSTVAAAIGVQFTQGLAAGVEGGTPQVAQSGVDAADALLASLQAELAAGLANAAAAQTAQTALTSLISSAVGQLPTVGSDVSAFTQRLATATTDQSKALQTYHKDADTYRADQQQVKDLTDQTGIAFGRLSVAQQKLAADTAAHAPKLTITEDTLGVKSAQSAFDSLNNKLTSAEANAAKAAGAYKTAGEQLNDANRALALASDPSNFIRNLQANTAASQRFESDLERLVKEGLPDLAQALAQQGPATAGKLADALASSPAKAKAAEAAIAQSNAFAVSYQQELDRLFGVGSTATTVAAKAGGALGVSLTNGLSTAVSAGTKQALGTLSAQLGAVPQLNLGAGVVPPVTAESKVASPFVATGPVLSGASASTFQLDLTVVMPDGQRVKAKAAVPIPASQPRAVASLTQQVVAEVHAN